MTRLRPALALALAAVAAPLSASSQDAPAPLRIAVPRTLLPVASRLAKDYESERGQHVDVLVRSSYDGIAAVRDGAAEIALTDTAADGEAYNDSAAAYVPFALVAHPGAGVANVTLAQARALLDGTVRSWREVGGADIPVVRIERPAASAAQRIVVRTLGLDVKRPAPATIDDTSSAVVQDVRTMPGAVGAVVVPLAGALDGVTVLRVDGRAPDAEALKAGYPLFGAEHVVTKASPPFVLQRLVGYIKADTAAWREARFVPIRDAGR